MNENINLKQDTANGARPLLPAVASFGAEFSECRKYRYALWRVWDESKPLVMFIGLNPSTANEVDNDPTIRSVGRIAKANGYGGFYMMNCWAYVATKPENLVIDRLSYQYNNDWLNIISGKCKDVVFAWGSFAIVAEKGRDKELAEMFPNAKALFINKNGSPKHPLYCKSDTQLVSWGNGR